MNLDDTGLPLSDFGYRVKLVTEQAYTLSDSDNTDGATGRKKP